MSKSQTAPDEIALPRKVDEKAIEFLYHIQVALRDWPDDFRLIMWETIARKANTYAARIRPKNSADKRGGAVTGSSHNARAIGDEAIS